MATKFDELINKNQEAERLIASLKSQIAALKQSGSDVSKCENEHKQLIEENAQLTKKIDEMKNKVIKSQISNGDKHIPVPEEKAVKVDVKHVEKKTEKPVENKQKAPEGKKEKQAKGDAKAAESDVIDASRLNMKVGKILEVSRHPDADSLYIEKVDVGEAKPRQIISGLVKYMSEQDLLGKMGIFLLNLKPAKMRGVLSEGMIMCASAPEEGVVEPLLLPDNVKPGDRVTVEGYDGEPDDIMNNKKKVFETIKPDLKVNADGVATYKGAKWVVNGQVGVIKSTKLKNVQIS